MLDALALPMNQHEVTGVFTSAVFFGVLRCAARHRCGAAATLLVLQLAWSLWRILPQSFRAELRPATMWQ